MNLPWWSTETFPSTLLDFERDFTVDHPIGLMRALDTTSFAEPAEMKIFTAEGACACLWGEGRTGGGGPREAGIVARGWKLGDRMLSVDQIPLKVVALNELSRKGRMTCPGHAFALLFKTELAV